jgi:2-polyprenyl-3-methyl-5-hydroxy-6-metoxy-1,4-benzoquinol methylase
MQNELNWYETWFNSKYYHILYQHRDEVEAEKFINRLFEYLKLSSNLKILDAACGNGRHAKFMATKNHKVWGVDLSEENINLAKKHNQANLNFFVHNLSEPLAINESFNLITNLFTSFGFSNSEEEDLVILKNLVSSLDKSGLIVFDYLNEKYVRSFANENKHEIKLINNITFDISREIEEETRIVKKNISISDSNIQLHFYEKVRLYSQEFFIQNLESLGANKIEVHNSYNLIGEEQGGNRCIVIAYF